MKTSLLYGMSLFTFLLAFPFFSAAVAHPAVSNAPVCPGPSSAMSARCHARVVTDKNGSPITNTTPSGYGPANFTGAYGVAGVSPSSGTIIGIVDAYLDKNIYSDLTTYSKQFGIAVLPKCSGSLTAVPCFANVNQNGSASPMPNGNAGWALETSLDVEVAHAMCPTCTILLVSANSASYSDLLTAVDTARKLGAKVVSNSYGSNEFSGETSYDAHFNYPGVAFTFSSGDSGYGVQYPAASKYVTAVGGTTLTLSGTTYVGESAWSGAGSGCSSYESQATWQNPYAGGVCSNRMVADVSADADPNTGAAIYDSVKYQGQSGWFQVGGTSLASPLVASVYALGGTISGQANSLPYGNTSSLHDVTSGSNGSCGTFLCNAGVGYDGPTGLGTPKGTAAF